MFLAKTIARPYAEAIFSIAKEENNLDIWSDKLNYLTQLVLLQEFFKLISYPYINQVKLIKLIFNLIEKSPIDNFLKKFIEILINNQRFVILPEIFTQFEILKNNSKKLIDAKIYSAFSIKDKVLDKLIAILEKKFQCKLHPNIIIDPSLIGGIIVQVGDKVLDTSVSSSLSKMKILLTT